MFCPKCGTSLKGEMQFCPKCGQAVPTQNKNWEESEIREEPEFREESEFWEEPEFREESEFWEEPDFREESEFWYDSDIPEEPKRKIWPFILIGAALLVAAASMVVYFTVIRPRQNASVISETKTEQRTVAVNERETTTAEKTTAEKKTTAETTTPAFPKVMYATATDGLLLRKGPGQQNEAIYLINYGRQITVEKTENGWAYTTVDGMTGWCSMQYLTENKSELQELPTVSGNVTDPNRLVEPLNRVSYGYHGYVNTPENLNMRYGPGENYGIVTVIPYLTEVVEEGWEGQWIYTQYNGMHGWVHSKYITASGGIAKPAIYLYPTETMDVSVRIKLKEGKFTRTAPESDGEWVVQADPDGTLRDKATGKTYDYIYWEADSEPAYDWSEGYVVEGCETEAFLKDILPKMGLNEKETKEFTDYWVPRMLKNPLNLVTFQTSCYTDAAQMEVEPKPDSVLRVFMAYKSIDRIAPVKAPKIKPFKREGFTVVEWGGAEVK